MSASLFLLELAAWLHLCQVPGTWYMGRRIVGIADELPRLSPLVSAIVVVLGIAVVTVLVGIGVLIAVHPHDVLGTSFGLALCGFLGTLFLARLAVQFWYYFGLPWPRTLPARLANERPSCIEALGSSTDGWKRSTSRARATCRSSQPGASGGCPGLPRWRRNGARSWRRVSRARPDASP